MVITTISMVSSYIDTHTAGNTKHKTLLFNTDNTVKGPHPVFISQ